MAAITISANASVDISTAQFAMQLSGKVAGEDINAGQPVYLKQSDDKIYKFATGKIFIGIAARTAKAGEPITVFGLGTRFYVSSTALTGDLYYVNVAGAIDTAATTDDTVGAFVRVSANDLMIVKVGKLN